MSHTSSRKWVSEQQLERAKYVTYCNSMRRMYGPTAQVPQTFNDWLEHRSRMMDAEADREKCRIAASTQKTKEGKDEKFATILSRDARLFTGGLSAVLALRSMWISDPSYHLPERHGGTVWPTPEEQIYEGDGRASTNYGRFLPIVRALNPENQPTKLKDVQEVRHLLFFPLDQVWQALTETDVYFPVDQIEADMIHLLLNQELLDALDKDYP